MTAEAGKVAAEPSFGDVRSRLAKVGRALLAPWIKPSDPRALAIVRVIIFWYEWPGFHVPDVTGFVAYQKLIFHPMGLLGALHVPVASAGVLYAVGVVELVSATCAWIGLGYRVTAPLAATSSLYLSWIVQGSGKTNHGGLLFAWVLFVMAFAHASDAWSVDALIRRLRGKAPAQPSAEYRWPVRFIALMVATQYGAAGLTKLLVSGWSWGLSGSLRWRLLGHHFSHHPPTRIGVWIAGNLLRCRILGFLSQLLEISAPLSMLHRWAYRVIIPSLALLQLSIWLTMGVLFREMVAIFVCLLPWDLALGRLDALVLALRRRSGQGVPHA